MSVPQAQPATQLDARQLRSARQQLRACMDFGADFIPLRTSPGHPEHPAPPDAAAVLIDPPPARQATSQPKPLQRPAAAPAPRPIPEPPPTPTVVIERKPAMLTSAQAEKQAALDRLRARYELEAPHNNFVTDHHCIVWGDGDPAARLMIIGEAPGAEEDKVGIPFVGRAGQLLEKMLGAMGLDRSAIYITNVLKTRPPNNATPTADEAAACAPYLYEQIRIIGPECILALGLPATRVLLNTTESMSRLRGRWWSFNDPRTIGSEVPVMPTYHPAFLLRSYTRENREKVWSDLQMVMQKLGLTPRPTGQTTVG
ncbi:MAG: uracil-DNA glycosylase [Phycisphaerales bacterium]